MSGSGVALECAARRLRTRRGRVASIVAAITIGIAGLLLVSVAGTVAGDRALQRAVDSLEPVDRAFTVTTTPDLTPPTDELRAINGVVTERLARRGLGEIITTVEYRSVGAGDGRVIRFAGIDHVDQVTKLVSGRMPARCDTTRCEVVAIAKDPAHPEAVAPLPAGSQLGLTVVGTVVPTSDLLMAGQLEPEPTEVIMLAEGVEGASALPQLSLFRRTYAWQVPVVASGLRSTDVEPLLDSVRSIADQPKLPQMFVNGPEDRLRSAVGRSRISTNRLAVPVGALLVLFFGVAALAGLGGRADHQRAAWVLRRRGAHWRAIALFRVVEAAVPVVAGALLGVGVAAAVGGWIGHRAGLGSGNVLDRSLDGAALTRAGLVALAALVLIVAVLGVRDVQVSLRRRPIASDVAGVAAIAILLVLAARGTISTASLGRDVDPALVAVPVLAAIALAAVVVRIVPAVLRAGANVSPRRWPMTKLTLAEATAQPLRSIATASLLAVTVMFALLSFGYGATLRLGSRDQAAFAVPYDFRLQLDADLVRPQALTPNGGWSSLAPGTTATDVLRRGISVRTSVASVQTVEALGLDPATLRSLHGWRDSFGPAPTRLAEAIDVPATTSFGSAIPADATSLRFIGTGMAGLHTSAVIRRVDGTWHELTLEDETADGVESPLTEGDAGGELIGFRLAQPADVSARIEHHVGEGNSSAEARPIDVVLQRVETTDAGGTARSITVAGSALHAANAAVVADGPAVHVTGSILGAAILVTPEGPGQDQPLPAIVDPFTARSARDGVLLMETASGTIRVHPVATVRRFPGAGGRFAIFDRDALQPALDLLQPGAGTANELWLASDGATHEQQVATALTDPRFGAIEIDRRSDRQHALATDPLSVVTLIVLAGSALVAVVLGALAVLLGAAADATDDRPLLRMLALERLRGSRLTAMVAGKSLSVVLVAIPLGLIAGRWLLQVATRLVAVSATSGNPNPALRLSVPWLVVTAQCIVLIAVLVASAWTGALSARRVPREDLLRGTA